MVCTGQRSALLHEAVRGCLKHCSCGTTRHAERATCMGASPLHEAWNANGGHVSIQLITPRRPAVNQSGLKHCTKLLRNGIFNGAM